MEGNLNKKCALLENGGNAFKEIIKCVQNAQESISINMFIWRKDNVGLKIATELLNAANRGVKIDISVDRYGFVLELTEESMQSFFHEKPTLAEKMKVASLKGFYKFKRTEFNNGESANLVKDELLKHPNVKVSEKVFKADHSKYYIFDGSVLILGGINIEDKENGCDSVGRVYQDYMVKICDNRLIDLFFNKINGKKNKDSGIDFLVNLKESVPKNFELKEHYLSVIKNAEKSLLIDIAYLSPVKEFVKEIKIACERGVEVTLLIPQSANFQTDLNFKAVSKIVKTTKGKAKVYLSPKMLHTKLIKSEKEFSLGSCNITKKAFKQLNELNVYMQKNSCDFWEELECSLQKNLAISRLANKNDLKYSKLRALVEGLLM